MSYAYHMAQQFSERALVLDHLTVVDADPVDLVRLARGQGCSGVGLFLASMPVLPLMPGFDCLHDADLRRALRTALADEGIALDLVYPFTLTARSMASDFLPALDCAAELGARRVNALVYDRDPARRVEQFAAFCDLARMRGLGVVVEFYPPSRIADLPAALELVRAVGRAGEVGVNVDLLHLMRSGGSPADLARAPAGSVLFAQLADGPIVAPDDPAVEASSRRLLPGEGEFDCAGFVRALPADCPLAIEAPRDADVPHIPAATRAERAVAAMRGL